MEAVEYWFLSNDMRLNPSKTEAIPVETKQQLAKNAPATIKVADSNVQLSEKLEIPGLVIDKTLTFDHHVTELCRSCNYHVRTLHHIRPSLSQELANTLACSMVQSRLDYCNSLLFGMSESNLNRLQCV